MYTLKSVYIGDIQKLNFFLYITKWINAPNKIKTFIIQNIHLVLRNYINPVDKNYIQNILSIFWYYLRKKLNYKQSKYVQTYVDFLLSSMRRNMVLYILSDIRDIIIINLNNIIDLYKISCICCSMKKKKLHNVKEVEKSIIYLDEKLTKELFHKQ